jgi:hypothetical protein
MVPSSGLEMSKSNPEITFRSSKNRLKVYLANSRSWCRGKRSFRQVACEHLWFQYLAITCEDSWFESVRSASLHNFSTSV